MPLAQLPLTDYLETQEDQTISYATLKSKFGDGYEQTCDSGINNKKVIWSVAYRALNETQTTTILNFLDSVRGSTPFLATPLGDVEQTWKLEPDSIKSTVLLIRSTDKEVIRSISFQCRKVYL